MLGQKSRFHCQGGDKMSLKNLSVLYVEDEREITELMKELIEDEVGDLYIAHDGEEGLRMYEQYKPDIVLSDIYMPKLDGLQMSEHIKEHFPKQPVVLLTAFNNIDDLKKAIKIGVDSYINKPIQSQDELTIPLNNIAKRLEENRELGILTKNLEHQNKYAAIGEVIGLITHQWRQPLSAISAEISHLQVQHELGQLDEKDMLDFMDNAAERVQYLSQTINDFRDYLKPRDTIQRFKLQTVFERINSLIGDKLHDDKVALLIPETGLILRGYQNKLLHVLMNLITNACDAFHKQAVEDRYIFIEVKEEDGQCTIIVKDTAGGIKEENISDIFNAYFTTKSDDKGTGLGLYMARKFVIVHLRGELDVENCTFEYHNKQYKGARFTITFPMELSMEEEKSRV